MPVGSRRVRVAVVSSVHRWNDTRILVKQAASLAAGGYDVILAAICDHRSPFHTLGIKVVPLPRRRRFMRWLTWMSILRLVLVERPAVVHAHDPELMPLMCLLKLIGRSVVCDVHEDIAEQVLHKEWIPSRWRRPLSGLIKMAQRGLPRIADAVILAEDSYVRNFPALPNVAIVRNFPLLPDRAKEQYSTDRLRLIYVGDVRKVRGILEYVSILSKLTVMGVPSELRIVGSFAASEEEVETIDLVRELGLEQRVAFLGRRPPDEIPGLIEECDVGLALLHPIGNYRESYPTKMFEYMASGLPVVASRFALWEKVLIGSDCGTVVDPLNVAEAAAHLQAYWTSQELRERQGRNGRAAVVSRYNWNREAATLLNLYASITPSPPRLSK